MPVVGNVEVQKVSACGLKNRLRRLPDALSMQHAGGEWAKIGSNGFWHREGRQATKENLVSPEFMQTGSGFWKSKAAESSMKPQERNTTTKDHCS
jgi:hypothetical protein